MQAVDLRPAVQCDARQPGRALGDLLRRLPPEDARLVREHLAWVAHDAMRHGLTIGASLLMANLEYGIDIDAWTRKLPSIAQIGAD